MTGYATDLYTITSYGGTPHRWNARCGEKAVSFAAPRLANDAVLSAAAQWHLFGKINPNTLDSLLDRHLDTLLAALDRPEVST